MTRQSSDVLDSFDGVADHDLMLRFASALDFPLVQSLVCHPSTVAALHDTVESAQVTIREIWREGLKPPDMRHIIVASQSDGNGIGYLRLLYPFEWDQCLWLSFITITHGLKGQGLGRKILKLLLGHARHCLHIQRFGMHALSTNTPAIRLFESLRFDCMKREPWENEDGTTAERLTFVQNLREDKTA